MAVSEATSQLPPRGRGCRSLLHRNTSGPGQVLASEPAPDPGSRLQGPCMAWRDRALVSPCISLGAFLFPLLPLGPVISDCLLGFPVCTLGGGADPASSRFWPVCKHLGWKTENSTHVMPLVSSRPERSEALLFKTLDSWSCSFLVLWGDGMRSSVRVAASWRALAFFVTDMTASERERLGWYRGLGWKRAVGRCKPSSLASAEPAWPGWNKAPPPPESRPPPPAQGSPGGGGTLERGRPGGGLGKGSGAFLVSPMPGMATAPAIW